MPFGGEHRGIRQEGLPPSGQSFLDGGGLGRCSQRYRFADALEKARFAFGKFDIPTTLADFPEGQEWVMEMVNNILIEVLGSIAQEERLKIRRRQREGIETAQKRGVNFGRPGVKKPEGYEEVMRKVLAGEMKAVDAMQVLRVKKTSFYKLRKNLLVASQG